ncbi:MAG: fibronectin type III domain-containing protein [Saprospiraceae bacterium]|nr:fibronectin type III domain-containing protein [Saprospiraceae bacterium]
MDRRIVLYVLKSTLIICFFSIPGWAQNSCPKADGLSVSDITETSAVLSWNGGDAVVTYNVDVKHGPQSSPFSWSTSTSETSVVVEGLSAGSSYRFRVMTKCDKGSGGSSKWVDFVTPGDPDTTTDEEDGGGPQNQGPCPKASNLAILEIDDTSAVLGWLGNEENVSYQVDVKQKEHTPTYKLTEIVDTTILYIDGLEPGGNYKFRVKSKCEKNSGGSSSWINFTTTGGDTAFQQCPKPTNLSVPEVTDTSALLTWIAKDSVESFSLDVKSYQGTPSFSLSITIEEDSFWVEGLVPDGDYHFRVVANCSDTSSSGSSDWSKFRTLPDTASMEEEPDPTDEGTIEPVDTGTVAQAEALIATFPNPAEESLTIQLPTEDLGYLTQIILSDVNGRIVYQTKLNGVPKEDRIPIPVQELRNGIYKLVIRSIDFHQTKTVLIQR